MPGVAVAGGGAACRLDLTGKFVVPYCRLRGRISLDLKVSADMLPRNRSVRTLVVVHLRRQRPDKLILTQTMKVSMTANNSANKDLKSLVGASAGGGISDANPHGSSQLAAIAPSTTDRCEFCFLYFTPAR